MCKLRNNKKTTLKQKPKQQKQLTRPIWTQNGGWGRRESLFPFIKNQNETSIVKQLY